MSLPVISRKKAVTGGFKRYFTGKPCRRGHTAQRLVSTRQCLVCKRLDGQAFEAKNSESRKAKARNYWRLRKNLKPDRSCPAVCELCGRPPKKRALHLDHDHVTGKFRGWLCGRCNVSIGALGDSAEGLQRAVRYLSGGAALPITAKARKGIPLYSGLIKYFPSALAAVAELSRIGNDQHNAGQPLHWDRSKSSDDHDALCRHLWEAGTIDSSDGVRHSTKVAWRSLAALQKEIEANRLSPPSCSDDK